MTEIKSLDIDLSFKKNNVDELLRDSKHYFFNVLYLRDTFMKVIGVE